MFGNGDNVVAVGVVLAARSGVSVLGVVGSHTVVGSIALVNRSSEGGSCQHGGEEELHLEDGMEWDTR